MLDTLGELAQLYQLATAVFVGGSLVNHGGHNILEPAIFGKPIVFGPHMQNFQEIADAFMTNGAAMQVQSDRELEEALLTLVTDPVRRARLAPRPGRSSRPTAAPRTRRSRSSPSSCRRPARGPEALSVPSDWCIDSRPRRDVRRGRAWRRRRYARASRRATLSRPVISVGNLRVGGSGKTPVVGYIARRSSRRASAPPS